MGRTEGSSCCVSQQLLIAKSVPLVSFEELWCCFPVRMWFFRFFAQSWVNIPEARLAEGREGNRIVQQEGERTISGGQRENPAPKGNNNIGGFLKRFIFNDVPLVCSCVCVWVGGCVRACVCASLEARRCHGSP